MTAAPKHPAGRACGAGAPRNPFGLERHAAGVLPFVFAPGQSPSERLGRLVELGGQAQVLGAEGTGKTTLLHVLSRAARARGEVLLEVRADRTDPRAVLRQLLPIAGAERPLTPSPNDGRAAPLVPTLICLDEADAWTRWQVGRLRRACRARRVRLLAATHRDLGLPTLLHCTVSDDLAVHVASTLLAAALPSDRLVAPERAREALRARGGNLREALLLLYDWHETAWADARGVTPRPHPRCDREITPSPRRAG